MVDILKKEKQLLHNVIEFLDLYLTDKEYSPIPSNNLVKMIKQYKKLIKMADNRVKSEVN